MTTTGFVSPRSAYYPALQGHATARGIAWDGRRSLCRHCDGLGGRAQASPVPRRECRAVGRGPVAVDAGSDSRRPAGQCPAERNAPCRSARRRHGAVAPWQRVAVAGQKQSEAGPSGARSGPTPRWPWQKGPATPTGFAPTPSAPTAPDQPSSKRCAAVAAMILHGSFPWTGLSGCSRPPHN